VGNDEQRKNLCTAPSDNIVNVFEDTDHDAAAEQQKAVLTRQQTGNETYKE